MCCVMLIVQILVGVSYLSLVDAEFPTFLAIPTDNTHSYDHLIGFMTLPDNTLHNARVIHTPVEGYMNMKLDADFHYERGLIFYILIGEKDIRGYKFARDGRLPPTLLNDEQIRIDVHMKVEHIAVDWLNDKIYFACQNRVAKSGEESEIWVTNLDGDRMAHVLTKNVLVVDSLRVDSVNRFMFWIEAMTIENSFMTIKMAGLDGSDPRSINIPRMNIVKDLTIDSRRQFLFWANINSIDVDMSPGGSIWVHDYNIGGGSTIKIAAACVIIPKLDYFEGFLFYYSYHDRAVMRRDVTDKYISTTGPGNCSDGLLFETVNRNPDFWFRVFESDAQLQPDAFVNECAVGNGGCSDFCLLSPRTRNRVGYRCTCFDYGRRLLDDERTCATHVTASIIFTFYGDNQQSEIRVLSLDTNEFISVAVDNHLSRSGSGQAKKILAMAYDPIDDFVYYVYTIDKMFDGIRKMRSDGSENSLVVTGDMAYVTALAIDFVSRNMYWCDQGKHAIEIALLDGSSRKLVVTDDLELPSGIAIDPVAGYLYWSDNESIERSLLDGSQRITLYRYPKGDGALIPVGLTIDLISNRLFWSLTADDYDRIEMYNLSMNTNSAVSTVASEVKAAKDLAVTGQYLYWTDFQQRQIKRIKIDGEPNQNIAQTVAEGMSGPTAIVAVNRSVIFNFTNPCSYKRGGCSHICVSKPFGIACLCPTGMELSRDNVSCYQPDAYLIVGEHYAKLERMKIYRKTLKVPQRKAFAFSIHDALATQFAIDVRKRHIYWLDEHGINRAFLNGTDIGIFYYFMGTGASFMPTALAVDYISGNVYYAITPGSIAIVSQRGIRKIISFDPRSSNVHMIALHPPAGLLFWVNHGDHLIMLVRSRLDGTDVEVIETNDELFGAALVVDIQSGLLFVSTTAHMLHRIRIFDLNGNSRDLISNSFHTSNMAVFGDKLYVVDRKNSEILAVKLPNITGYTEAEAILYGQANWLKSRTNLINIVDGDTFERALQPYRKQQLEIVHKMVIKSTAEADAYIALAVIHDNTQPGTNKCSVEDTCDRSNICIARPTESPFMVSEFGDRSSFVLLPPITCECPTHFSPVKMPLGGQFCQAPDTFLLIGHGHWIDRAVLQHRQLSRGGSSSSNSAEFDPSLPVETMNIQIEEHITIMQYDAGRRTIYWMTTGSGDLMRARDDKTFGAQAQVTRIRLGGGGEISDFCIDSIGAQLFIIDKTYNSINVSKLPLSNVDERFIGRNSISNIGVVVLMDKSRQPILLAIHSLMRYFFFVSCFINGNNNTNGNCEINRCQLNGKDCIRLDIKNVGIPTAIHVDQWSDMLFWSDSNYYIHKTTIGGQYHTLSKQLVSYGTSTTPIISLTTAGSGSRLFIARSQVQTLEYLNVNDFSDVKPSRVEGFSRKKHISSLISVEPRDFINAEKSSCRKIECDGVCMITKSYNDANHQAFCSCVNGFIVDRETKRKCVPIVKCPFDYLSCSDQLQCYQRGERCNNKPFCIDGSDEDKCNNCFASDSFSCLNGSGCIDQSKVCNGYRDCSDGSDELNCRCGEHTTTQIDCLTHNGLISSCFDRSRICDGRLPCPGRNVDNICGFNVDNPTNNYGKNDSPQLKYIIILGVVIVFVGCLSFCVWKWIHKRKSMIPPQSCSDHRNRMTSSNVPTPYHQSHHAQPVVGSYVTQVEIVPTAYNTGYTTSTTVRYRLGESHHYCHPAGGVVSNDGSAEHGATSMMMPNIDNSNRVPTTTQYNRSNITGKSSSSFVSTHFEQIDCPEEDSNDENVESFHPNSEATFAMGSNANETLKQNNRTHLRQCYDPPPSPSASYFDGGSVVFLPRGARLYPVTATAGTLHVRTDVTLGPIKRLHKKRRKQLRHTNNATSTLAPEGRLRRQKQKAVKSGSSSTSSYGHDPPPAYSPPLLDQLETDYPADDCALYDVVAVPYAPPNSVTNSPSRSKRYRNEHLGNCRESAAALVSDDGSAARVFATLANNDGDYLNATGCSSDDDDDLAEHSQLLANPPPTPVDRSSSS